MKRHILRLVRISAVLIPAVLVLTPCPRAQTTFVAVDLFTTELGGPMAGAASPQLIGGSPLMLGLDGQGGWFVRTLTLEYSTGIQLGQTVDVTHPPSPCVPPDPCRLVYSEHFMPGEVIILGDDRTWVHFPLAILPDGTPSPGISECVPPFQIGFDVGNACALTELPAVQFQDQLPRLVFGTSLGYLLFLVPGPDGPEPEHVANVVDGEPISTVRALPQVGYIAVGAMTPSGLHGIQYSGPAAGAARVWTRTVSHPTPCFDVFDLGHPPEPGSDPLLLVFSDGVSFELKLVELPVDAAGTEPLRVSYTPDLPPFFDVPVLDPVAGSLLMLMADSETVYFNPNFYFGFGTCMVDITEHPPQGCGECLILVSGDVNISGAVTSADIIRLVSYVFKGGMSPEPCTAAGDVNCDGVVSASDIIYMVNFVFKGMNAPCDVCQIIPIVWTCN